MILSKIIKEKQIEVDKSKSIRVLSEIEKQIQMLGNCYSLKELVMESKVSIIAEFKRKSPSAGTISDISLPEIIKKYHKMEVAALSILTDSIFFGGSLIDLQLTRKYSNKPILRKDFIIDEYQIYESRLFGADLVLLIASCLKPEQLKLFSKLAKSLGMEVLLEIHSQEEYENYISDDVDFVGVNNRNLNTLECNMENSIQLIKYIDKKFIAISESGIKSQKEIEQLSNLGYKGFLIGESLLKSELNLKM